MSASVEETEKSTVLNSLSVKIRSQNQSTKITIAAMTSMTLKASSYHSMLIIIDSTSEDLKSLSSTKYALKRDDKFFIERRFEVQELSQKEKEMINEWFELSKITIDSKMNTLVRIEKTKRLLYI